MSPETITQGLVHIAGAIFTAGLVWGTVRTELRNLHGRMSRCEKDSERAHARIDHILEGKKL